MRLTPKNWQELQHYKDRAPVWIKLHRKLLDDFEFHCLPVASRALAPMLWLLSSEYENGAIDASCAKIAFRLRMSEADFMDALKPLIDNGFFSLDQDASKPLAECLPRDREETETEKETDKGTPDKPARFDPLAIDLPDSVPAEVWGEWIAYRRKRKLTVTEPTMKAQVKKLAEFASRGCRPDLVIQQSIANGWQGLFELKSGQSGRQQSRMNDIGVDDEIPEGFRSGH